MAGRLVVARQERVQPADHVAARLHEGEQTGQLSLGQVQPTFAGQRARSNNITVDGLDNNDSSVGSVRAVFSQEAVQEFQVLTQQGEEAATPPGR